MIVSFKNRSTEMIWMGVWKDFLPEDIQIKSRENMDKLDKISSIEDLQDDKVKIMEDESGYYSLDVNDRWRIIFLWDGRNAQRVQLIWHK
ncbi:type II toxin-antitoxin system RelE/ParE family toxin [Alistipes sp. ZOR0009]|uniref:type II toxin-antitoxin system RelE/ParE family toxin n=1 Tax=Alistipes sp. ZOR0009 TaxID=1339253 RepID=UPI0006486BB3|nr:type II toxin-antitoxin system RelE/ParE family toxin [Alistipes sp. ZOR0009]